MAAKKEVILKCRFGEHLPDPRVPVELDKKDADYLIGQGLASEPTEGSVQSNVSLKTENTGLKKENEELLKKIAVLEKEKVAQDEKIAVLEATVADLQKVNSELASTTKK